MNIDKIYLTTKVMNGGLTICDQHGRELAGLMSFSNTTEQGSLASVDLSVYLFENVNGTCQLAKEKLPVLNQGE